MLTPRNRANNVFTKFISFFVFNTERFFSHHKNGENEAYWGNK